MGRNLLKRIVCAGLISGSIFVGNMVEAGVVTDRLPLTCYADHKVITYNSPGAKSAGYISANVDLIQITQVRGDGWCYGSYPGAGGRRVARWFKITDVCADAGYTNRSAKVKGRQTVYRTRSGGATIGSVSNNEGVIVVADNGSRAQIVYRLDNGTGYKLGWVPSAAVPPPVSKPVILKGDVNGDGKIDETDNKMAIEIFLGDRAYNPAADINNDGQVTAQDLSTIRELANRIIPNNVVNLNVVSLKQTDSRWKNVKIGTKTIGAIGCTVTSLTMKYNYHNNTNLTPANMKSKLKFSNNDILWSSVRNLGYTVDLVSNRPALNNTWMSKIYTQLKNGKPVILGAYQASGGQHWVVIKGYNGNSTSNFNAGSFAINDPMNSFTNLQQFINKYNRGLRGMVY